jgi:hypothetical protein
MRDLGDADVGISRLDGKRFNGAKAVSLRRVASVLRPVGKQRETVAFDI